jgi:tripartite-type tricarboxylate transporter receptor subunit TctC
MPGVTIIWQESRMKCSRYFVVALFAFAASASLAPASADYPERPVRIIYPYTAGGSGDALARVYADRLSAALRQQFFVENRPGAGGNVGFAAGAKSAPDGYTVIFVSAAFTINGSLYASPGFNPTKDFVPIAAQSIVPNVLLVNTASPFKTVNELVAYAKANPGKLTFGSSGVGTSTHMAGEAFKQQAGINIVHVPYRGAANVGADLLGGRLDLIFDSAPAALSNIRTGMARALAVASTERLPDLPDVPTTKEAGFPDLLSAGWTGMVVPAGTPADICEKLSAAAIQVNNDPHLIAQLAKLGGRPFNMKSREEFEAFIKRDIESNAALVKAAGLRIE